MDDLEVPFVAAPPSAAGAGAPVRNPSRRTALIGVFAVCALSAVLAVSVHTSRSSNQASDDSGAVARSTSKTSKSPQQVLGLDDGWTIALPLDAKFKEAGPDCSTGSGNRVQIDLDQIPEQSDSAQRNIAKYFYVDGKGGAILKAPCWGASSGNCAVRTELKADPSTNPHAEWYDVTKGKHTLQATMAVENVVQEEQRLTLLQMHGDVAPLAKLYYKSGKLGVEYDCKGQCKQNSHDQEVDSIDLGEVFTASFELDWPNVNFLYCKSASCSPKVVKSVGAKISGWDKWSSKFTGTSGSKSGGIVPHVGAYDPCKIKEDCGIKDHGTPDPHQCEDYMQDDASYGSIRLFSVKLG